MTCLPTAPEGCELIREGANHSWPFVSSRHAARIAAVEILYGADVRGCDALELLDDREDADPFCRHLVEAVARRATSSTG